MKRLHIHVHVEDLARNVAFYSAMFGAQPTRSEVDYAKWMLDEPAVNFAISTRGQGHLGVDHLGIQVDTEHFRTLGSIPVFSEATPSQADVKVNQGGERASCAPRVQGKPVGIPGKTESTGCC